MLHSDWIVFPVIKSAQSETLWDAQLQHLKILTAAPVKITNLTKKESTVHLACCSVLFNARTLGHTTLSMIVQVTTIKGVCEAATTSLHKPCRKLNYMG
jgi:hypothetical protein